MPLWLSTRRTEPRAMPTRHHLSGLNSPRMLLLPNRLRTEADRSLKECHQRCCLRIPRSMTLLKRPQTEKRASLAVDRLPLLSEAMRDLNLLPQLPSPALLSVRLSPRTSTSILRRCLIAATFPRTSDTKCEIWQIRSRWNLFARTGPKWRLPRLRWRLPKKLLPLMNPRQTTTGVLAAAEGEASPSLAAARTQRPLQSPSGMHLLAVISAASLLTILPVWSALCPQLAQLVVGAWPACSP